MSTPTTFGLQNQNEGFFNNLNCSEIIESFSFVTNIDFETKEKSMVKQSLYVSTD